MIIGFAVACTLTKCSLLPGGYLIRPEKGSFSYFHGAFLRGSVFVLCVCNIRTLPTWTPPCSENFTESFTGFLMQALFSAYKKEPGVEARCVP